MQPQYRSALTELAHALSHIMASTLSAQDAAAAVLDALMRLAHYRSAEFWLQRKDAPPRLLHGFASDAPQRRLDVDGGFLLLFGTPDAGSGDLDDLARDAATFLIRRTLADDELTETRVLLRRVQVLTNTGYCIRRSPDSRMEWCEQAYRIFGRDPAIFTLTPETLLECVHPHDRPVVARVVAEACARDGSLDFRVIRSDGTIAVVELRHEVEHDDAGNPARAFATLQDVTARRHADEMLFELSSAVQQTADHVMITDRDGRIEYVNPAFEHATGYQLAEVAGLTPRILKSEQHPPAFYDKMWQTIASGDVFRGVLVNRAKNGRLVYEEKTITPIRDRDGTITHFVSTGRDITKRHAAEQEQERLRKALQISAQEWRQTFDAIEMPILVINDADAIRRMNRAAQELIAAPFEEIAGHSIDALPRCEPWITLRAMVRATAETGRSDSVRVSDPVSQRTWEVASMAGPHTIMVIRDVTAIAILQASLRRSEMTSALGMLVAGVAHEVRNPLFGISATIDALEERRPSRRSSKPFMRRLRGELSRLTELMQELLEYGRPAERELVPTVAITPLLDALRTLHPLAAKLSVRVDINAEAAKSTPIIADASRLQLAFRNLLENAIHHAGKGGVVTATMEQCDGMLHVRVADTGPGFAPDDLTRLFEPFFTRRRGGTGLGLPIVQRVIEQHGGTIHAGNQPCGGAFVHVSFPLTVNR